MFDIIEQLAKTPGKNDKLAILKANKDNTELRGYFEACLNPHRQYYIRKIPAYLPVGQMTLAEALERIKALSSREVTGNAAVDYLQEIFTKMDANYAPLLENVIAKDPRCGVSTGANKVWKGLIPKHPCLLASAYSDKLLEKFNWDGGVYCQLKSDGMRANIIIDETGTVKVTSRSGKELHVNGIFDYIGQYIQNIVIDGELLARDNNTGKILDRQTGNGICNKATKGTQSLQESNMLFLNSWDIIPLESFISGKYDVPYSHRIDKLVELISDLDLASENVTLVETTMVNSVARVREIYAAYIECGEEGLIIKDADMIWEDRRTKKQMKFKEVLDADLRITGMKEGTGKYVGMLGALELSDDAGNVKVSVGTGFSDAQRKEFWNDREDLIGNIAEIKYNAMVKERTSDHYSLFLPVFVEIRTDKDATDNLL